MRDCGEPSKLIRLRRVLVSIETADIVPFSTRQRNQMRLLPILISFALIFGMGTRANAWERDTVDRQISRLCEQRNADDWPAQEECIVIQSRALQTLCPPRADDDLVAAYRSCKEAAASEYDFAAIQHCYREKMSTIIADRAAAAEIAENTELASIFPTLPVIVRCSFSDGRVVEIRRSSKHQDAIVAKVTTEKLFAGRSGAGYSYEWDGPQGVSFKLDGNQLTDRSSGPAKLFMGKCEYR